MLKKGSFVKKIFLSILFLNILSRFGNIINVVLDAVSGGNILGEDVLSIVSVISPLFYFISFFASLFGPGCAILFGINIGKFNKEEADRYAGLSLVSSILIGSFCALILLIFKKPFLSFYEISDQLYQTASVYYNWYIGISFVIPVYFSLYYLVLADGDALFNMLGALGEIVTNAVLSFVLCKSMGIGGLGLASFLSYVVAILFNCMHFFKKKNSIRFKLCLNFKMLKKATVLSSNSALNSIFIVLVDVVINKVVILTSGSAYIPAYTVINFVLSVYLLFGAVGDSGKSLCATYFGEKNYQGVKNTVNLSNKVISILGALLTVILFVCAPVVPKLFGITNSNLLEVAVRAVRIVSLSAIPFGISYFCYQIYSSVNKPSLSLLSTFLFNLTCPLFASILLALVFGFDGISIGTSLSAFLSVGIFCLFLVLKYGKKHFPLYLDETTETIAEYDFVLAENTIVEMRDTIGTNLSGKGYETKNIELLFEELFTKIYDKNNGKKIVCECSLFFGSDYVRVIVRDSGVIFNFIDQDNHSDSLNTLLLNNLLTKTKEKDYLITSSVNRNCFIFRKHDN